MKLADARAALREARHVAVLTGAGVSAESGIPTFRDAQTGHWARFRPEDLASPGAYFRDPALVWEWYAGRYRDVTRAQPNGGHALLTQLEREKGDGFFLATQNVDGLHTRAGSGAAGGQLVELHGNLTTARCEVCDWTADLPAPDHFTPPPSCPDCGGRMRPNVVWFGEDLPETALAAAATAFAGADVALIIGTSGVVYPAAGLAAEALRRGAVAIEVNPVETNISWQMTFAVRDVASRGLAALLGQEP
ncbi:SIR2 family NAD-dependent protein deacylase [Deinococcus aerophilus]|uniref:NAD-dependent protein deacylase n=1 Tax=Deinococcus aerophilus TaxID=522488 RepID=A0ABQ2GH71_9DEIO|nr:NAD-dependent deacylase [Deinococcus aerophilus]GGL96230.1 NAD-dependent protein deacylase [Deinococcus aerophilus]